MNKTGMCGLSHVGIASWLIAVACTTMVGPEDVPAVGDLAGGSGGVSSGAAGEQNASAGDSSGGSEPTPSGGSAAQGEAGQPASGPPSHDFIITDDYHHQVTLVSELTSPFSPGAIVWGGPGSGIPGVISPRSLQLVDDPSAPRGKSVLVSIADGFMEIGLDGDGWRVVSVDGVVGVRSACRLLLGETALATDTEMVIVDEDGAVVRSFDLPEGAPLGIVRHNPATKTFWFARGSTVYEVDELGEVVSTLHGPAGNDFYSASWRVGGGFIATTGAGASLIEVNDTGDLLTTRGGQQSFPELQYLAGFNQLVNGHVIVANWLGAVPFPEDETPHLVELTPQNEIVWRWGNQDLSRQIADVLVLQ